jgi:hypothetical protein
MSRWTRSPRMQRADPQPEQTGYAGGIRKADLPMPAAYIAVALLRPYRNLTGPRRVKDAGSWRS